jgi:hypothetical protein
MTIELIIRGNHTTDMLAELQNLAAALGGSNMTDEKSGHNDDRIRANMQAVRDLAKTHEVETDEEPEETVKEEPQETTGKKPPLTVKKQEEAIKKMLNEGEIITDLYERLSIGRQKMVDDGLAEQNNDESVETVEMVFDEAITKDSIRALMSKLSKDEDGIPIQDNLTVMRDILVKYVPKGMEVMVKHVPDSDVSAMYADLVNMEKGLG